MKKRTVYYYNSKKPLVATELGIKLQELILDSNKSIKEILILCIGTDRSTGDSLGPLVGHMLFQYEIAGVSVYGSLDNPVHAANLECTLQSINAEHNNPFVIAIDASLGKTDHIGYITLGEGPLTPGLGVNKSLPPVGDLHITGIVNMSISETATNILQSTRLSLVMHMADTIKEAILYCLAPSKSNIYRSANFQASYLRFLSSSAFALSQKYQE